MSEENDVDRNGALSRAIKSLGLNLTSSQKRKMGGMTVLIFLSAIFDVFGLASILPLVKLAADPKAIHANNKLHYLYDYFGFTSDKTFLLVVILIVFGFFVFKSAFGLFVNYLQTKFSTQIAHDITKRQFNKFFGLDFHTFTGLKSSNVLHSIINNPTSYISWVILPLIMLVSEGFIVILIVGGIAIYDIKLFLFIACIIGPATWLIYRLLRNKSSIIGAKMNMLFPQSMGTLNQTISGYIDIKLADREVFYRDKFLRLQQSYHSLNMKSYLQNLIPIRANELVALSGIVLIFIYAIFLTDNSDQAIVMVSLFAAAAYRLMPSLNRIISSMVYIQKNLVAMDNLNLYSDIEKARESEPPQVPVVFENDIKINNLSFTFPDNEIPTLKNISMEVKKGEKIGIVGSSGSGKTTLMNVLLRFYEEQQGEICIDGKKLGLEHIRGWRNLIGYVKQDIFLMDNSIRDNITFGDWNADEERVRRAVTQASLDNLIDSLPEGLDTIIGERGSKLSGGQRQRISIARSLYRNAQVLIFDEATSALDNQTEQEVSDAIDSLSDSHKTIFIIAHRITTLRNCDRIYELKDGRVDGIYTYKELLEKVM
ncbi:MAG TPA: ABC transporter ATP-binding protein [Bacteroidia bacterium]|jgi:ABC-type multidrug transport system fused ATPase/permease subunit|nr:ABC transporter ATP-binding protein [Bacteroidia bacterium]HQF27781.1 ABC transporter ATP-binding protein [Bacteroidia bacterium]HQK96901.1 ABC transporter ATP-binding protein [Bacteroidia bacterium]